MRVCFTGSRHFKSREQVRERVRQLVEEHGSKLEVAHGKSPGGGVDRFVEDACMEFNVIEWPFPVRSGKNGIDGPWPAAGHKRNERMLRGFMPDMLIAFRASGKSNGTDHCVRTAHKLGIEVEMNGEESL